MNRNKYEVNVGNIGILTYTNKKEAIKVFKEYVVQSKQSYGRASGEDVFLLVNGEIEKEYYAPLRPCGTNTNYY